ncbi:MAG TPA: hypothetical protein VFE63_21685 [Roseiarcus sp.]|jgi:hypothetical protein|nr:hypothetical protein [Roseiarcus sp.]
MSDREKRIGEAGAALIDMMAGAWLTGVRRLPCLLVVHGSCGANRSEKET